MAGVLLWVICPKENASFSATTLYSLVPRNRLQARSYNSKGCSRLKSSTGVYAVASLSSPVANPPRSSAEKVYEVVLKQLEGKVALITGGASGIGKTTAHEFIKHGARVIIADVDSQIGPQAADELGPAAHFVHCDVTAEAQVENAVEIAMTSYGKLHIMYNNAGITGPSFPPSIADLDLNEFDKVMQINVRGIVVGIKHAARAMIPAGSGCILCTSSISGLMGGLGSHSYSASKSTIPGIVKSVASELCENGVRINCISPGPIPTALSLVQIGLIYPGASREQLTEIVNGLGKLKGAKCEEIDVAEAALFLASDEAKYITGHNLVVDGGLTCFKNLALPSPREFV